MDSSLYYSTVTPLLRTVLAELMQEQLFKPFRLVGGTSLSLQIGHRMSDDIDLFTDELYGSIDFDKIDALLQSRFSYVQSKSIAPVAFGKMYTIGENSETTVKLDLMYSTEIFIRDAIEIDGIRMATAEEIIAMKLDILTRGGRKKDFWDLHAFIEKVSLGEMIALYNERYPYTDQQSEIIKGFTDFRKADNEPDPNCRHGKYWELIKEDLIDFAAKGK